jgi:hypothetical protein
MSTESSSSGPAAVAEVASTLSGDVLDAFFTQVTERLPERPATAQTSDSPGAMLDRLRRLTQ